MLNVLAGMGMRDIGSKAMDFGLQMMGVVEKHYPVSFRPVPLLISPTSKHLTEIPVNASYQKGLGAFRSKGVRLCCGVVFTLKETAKNFWYPRETTPGRRDFPGGHPLTSKSDNRLQVLAALSCFV